MCLHIRSMADCPHNICRLECSVWLSVGICICCKSDLFSYKTLPTFCGQQQLHNWKFRLILLTLVKVNLMKYERERHSLSRYLTFKTTVDRLQSPTSKALNITYDIQINKCISHILDSNLIWPSRGRDVFPGPD